MFRLTQLSPRIFPAIFFDKLKFYRSRGKKAVTILLQILSSSISIHKAEEVYRHAPEYVGYICLKDS